MVASNKTVLRHYRTAAFYLTMCLLALVGVWVRAHGCGIQPDVISVHRLPKIRVLRLRKRKHLQRNPHADILFVGC